MLYWKRKEDDWSGLDKVEVEKKYEMEVAIAHLENGDMREYRLVEAP